MDELKLKAILESHVKWIKNEEGGKRANLRSANLRYADLRSANLRFANLRSANLQYANLQYADLRSANLRFANLRSANLQYANLQSADLQYADLDFSCLPLHCGGLHIKIDVKIAIQIAYHLCSMDCDDPEFREVRKNLIPFANKFHRVEECGELKADDEHGGNPPVVLPP